MFKQRLSPSAWSNVATFTAFQAGPAGPGLLPGGSADGDGMNREGGGTTACPRMQGHGW